MYHLWKINWRPGTVLLTPFLCALLVKSLIASLGKLYGRGDSDLKVSTKSTIMSFARHTDNTQKINCQHHLTGGLLSRKFCWLLLQTCKGKDCPNYILSDFSWTGSYFCCNNKTMMAPSNPPQSYPFPTLPCAAPLPTLPRLAIQLQPNFRTQAKSLRQRSTSLPALPPLSG